MTDARSSGADTARTLPATGAVFDLRLHGVRGSLPMATASVARYGGATICIELRVAGRVLIFDAGSGIHPAGQALRAEGVREIDLFLSHWHYDHTIGLPFFAPLYCPETRLTLWSGHAATGPARELLAGLMRAPYFPVGPEVFRATLETRDFDPPETFDLAPGLRIRTLALNHPGSATAYRVEAGGRALCIVTDVEHVPGVLDPAVTAFVAGADLMLYDSMYDDGDMCSHCGFGHSSWQQALRIARAAGVGQVGFVHHAPFRTDDALDAIATAAATEFPGAFVARQGMRIAL
ncbi:MBL fold metallo-hydrolase [Paenirhodobacter enshiensis]|uniref:MBL fold metallo-hydrolase n=1 Tax=Paenirhodobacter enshiensis TaxID=1105367 RepID=UPI003FA23FF7